ncbi:hypothetical protein [Stomatobaculum longum]|uniref:hypothetical protein n=1 Tax=Stomatobaculum longum TaxID=796942 RepID=UPI0028F0C5EF|nr:hypothetical protein [Stomatobaculum longum]
MRRKKMALALLATASLVLVTACGGKKNSDTTAAESASSAVESMTETASGESTDPGDENVVYDTLSPEEQASIEASEAAEEAEENEEEAAEEETEAKAAETKSQAKATRQTYPSQIFHEGEDPTEAPEPDNTDDSGPTGKVTKIKKNKAGNYVKPESTSRAVEPPSDATMPESGH